MPLYQPQCDQPASKNGVIPSGRRKFLAATVAAPLLWATACANSKPLVLAGHPWPGYEPMFLARAMGYMPQQLTLMESPTLQASIDAVQQGSAHGVMLTLDEILVLRAQGVPLQVVLVFDVSKGADVLLARTAMTNLGALRGQRVGLEDTALGTLMLSMILEKAGLRQQDVTPVRVVYEEHEAAWQRGDLDALITYEPAAGRLKAAGARQLLSTRELPDTIFDVLAVRPDIASERSDTLRDTLTGHFKALTYLRQNPWDSAYRVAPRLHVTAEEMVASLRGLELPDVLGNHRYLMDNGGHILPVVKRLSAILLQSRLIAQSVDLRNLFSDAYLPRESA